MIDTAAKRFSMMNFGTQPIIPLFIPDGTVDAGDKYHLLTLYSGIALGSTPAPIFSGSLSNLNIPLNSEAKTFDYSGYFDTATSYSISPALEAGWSFNTATGLLTVNPLVVGNYGVYVITGTNAGGSDSSNAFYIEVSNTGSRGGDYRRRTLKPLSEYEDEIKRILDEEAAKILKEQKKLKKAEATLKAKLPAIDKQNRQYDETRLKYLVVSESLLQVKKDLAVIKEKRAQISLKARIMKDDDEVIMLLMSEGYL